MNRRVAIASVAIIPMAAAPGLLSGRASAGGAAIPFDDAKIIIETNASDRDAGLQFFLDGEPWSSIEVRDPEGRRVLEVEGEGNLEDFGLTELFSETNEPELHELPLEELFALFPEGEYTFLGTTVDGVRLTGSAMLSHEIPRGPEVVSPEEDEEVPPDDLVIEWESVTDPPGIEIAGYQVIVEREDPLRVFQVDLPADATTVTVPSEFLEPDTEYTFEVLAIEVSGNQTITEQSFLTTS